MSSQQEQLRGYVGQRILDVAWTPKEGYGFVVANGKDTAILWVGDAVKCVSSPRDAAEADRPLKVGDRVMFGRGRGEKTLGEVVKVNVKSVKVKQLETRGTRKTYDVGSVWKVPHSLCERVAMPTGG